MTTKVASSLTRTPLPISPVQVNGSVLDDIDVRSVTVRQCHGLHDELTLNCLSSRSSTEELKDQPIYFRFGLNPSYGYFYGYIRVIQKNQKFQENINLVITAVGHSSVARASHRRFFLRLRPDQVINEVADGISLSSYIDPHWFTHGRIAQCGRTDWEFMNGIAGIISHRLYSYNGVLWGSHPIKELEKRVAFRTLEKSIQILDNKPLMDFTPKDEVKTQKEDIYHEYSYFVNGQVQSYSPDVPDYRKAPLNAYVYGDLGRVINERSEVRVSLQQKALARVRGMADMIPGMVVDLRTGRSEVAKDSFDGLWYVTEVQHEISEKVFQTQLGLIRDTFRTAKSGAYEPFYASSPDRLPLMILRNGLWVSNWSAR